MAFPAWPSITVGQKLDSATVQAMSDFATAVTPLYAEKPSDQSITSSTVLVNITSLSLPFLASATYKVLGNLYINAGTTPDVKIAATAPSGATGYANCRGEDVTAPNLFSGTYIGANSAFTTAFALAGAGSVVLYVYDAMVKTTNAGTFQIQGAQNTSDGTAATFLALSNLTAWRVA